MDFSSAQLLAALRSAPICREYVVALSGGLDSTVLLHALVQLREQGNLQQSLTALHVNHGLHAEADAWQQHCQSICSEWGVPLHCEAVAVPLSGSLENAARDARYDVFLRRVAADSLLLQAHHLDDQMETLLLRLLRGAGPSGLAAIPQLRQLASGAGASLFRPLLQVPRASLADYARNTGLTWQEDGSNADQRHDRNYLRHAVLPLLEARWPGYRASWGKSLELLANAASLSRELAEEDLVRLETPAGSLNLTLLRDLGEARQKNVLRHWLSSLELEEPGWKQLQSLHQDLLDKSHSEGAVNLQGCLLRVFNNELFVLEDRAMPVPPSSLEVALVSGECIELPDNGRLQVRNSVVKGLKAELGSLQIRYRDGGEQLRLCDRPQKSLKSLFQEMGVPPWLRDRVPLLYDGEKLVCVPGIGVAADALADTGEPAFTVHWEIPWLVRKRPDSAIPD